MPKRQTRDGATPSREITDHSLRRTIPASKLGVTLTISDTALKGLERIREETVKAAQEDQEFFWR